MHYKIPENAYFQDFKKIIPTLELKTSNNLKSILLFFRKRTLYARIEIQILSGSINKKVVVDLTESYIEISDLPKSTQIKICIKVLNGDVAVLCIGKKPYYVLKDNIVTEYSPLISVVTPTYNTDLFYFKKTYKSILYQKYSNWEWCIVDDGSSDLKLKNFLRSIKGDRIKVKFLSKNNGISMASNEAIKMCKGEYIGFLDHDDLLHSEALLEVVSVIRNFPDVKLIYTDEGKIIEDSVIDEGTFYKPDFNYDMLLSCMYICHFLVVKSSLVVEVGGFRRDFDGAQDYDLVLRVIEKIKQGEIKHISKVLYYWRVTRSSTSFSILSKPHARMGGLLAVKEHLNRLNVPAVVYGSNFPCHYNVRYILKVIPKISLIVLFKDKVSLLRNFVRSMEITDYENYDIILVNNNSKEKETFEYLRDIKSDKIKVVDYNGKFNFSKINNFIVNRYIDSEFVLFMNNDIEIIHPEWLYNLVQYFVREDVGVVGPKLLYLDHRIQHAGIFVGVGGIAKHIAKGRYDWDPCYFSRPHIVQEVCAVTGACMLVKKEDFLKVDGFDENLPYAFNDIDLCLKFRKIGKKIVYTPLAKLYHHESVTRGYDSLDNKQFIKYINYMREKWDIDNYKDPYFNPNIYELL